MARPGFFNDATVEESGTSFQASLEAGDSASRTAASSSVTKQLREPLMKMRVVPSSAATKARRERSVHVANGQSM